MIFDEELEEAISYNEHAIFMSRIATEILRGNAKILNKKGVRELIAMYLLIPYITNKQLDKPDEIYCNIPKLDLNSNFAKVYNIDRTLSDMTLDGMRNAICHSFVSLTGDGDLLLDDRASLDPKVHSRLSNKGFCNRLELDKTNKKLLQLHENVIKQQNEFMLKYLKIYHLKQD